MSEREPFWPLLLVVAVLAVAVFTLSLSVNWWGNTVYKSVLVTALVLMVVADIQIIRDYRKKKVQGIPRTDERLDKIVVYASMYSFRVGILFMSVLIFSNLFDVVATDTVTALSASVFVMAGVYFVFHWYFDKKGDVEVI